jgi:hypothetical protein
MGSTNKKEDSRSNLHMCRYQEFSGRRGEEEGGGGVGTSTAARIHRHRAAGGRSEIPGAQKLAESHARSEAAKRFVPAARGGHGAPAPQLERQGGGFWTWFKAAF